MSILLKRRDGSTTPFRNAEFLPAFYMIPQEILIKCGLEMCSVPRNPRELITSYDAIAQVESDLFQLTIIDSYAYMVWPYMGVPGGMENYSGFNPAWRYAHAVSYWIDELQEAGILPKAQDLLKNGGLNQRFGFVSLEEISYTLATIVPMAMKRHGMNEVIAVAQEMPCFEDFESRNSSQKIDFYRKWYHTRTDHPQISLESYQEDYTESHNGQSWDIEDERQEVETGVTSKVLVEQFLDTLSEKDKQILTMRMQEITFEKIAEALGFKTHSAVIKRIKKIGLAYEKFTGKDLGF